MSKKVAVLIVALGTAALMVLFGIFAALNQSSRQQSFASDGYLLAILPDDVPASTQHYFTRDTAYRSSYGDGVVFTDTMSQQVAANSKSFLHYTDKSIGSLCNGVVMDLSVLRSEVATYYNLPAGALMKYDGGSYSIDNLGNTTKFDSLLWKLGDDKYLVAGAAISAQLSEQASKAFTEYVEVSFLDGGIIQLCNEEGSYTSISKNCYLDMGDGLTVNLSKGTVYLGEEPRMNLRQMSLEDEANIDIVPEAGNMTIPKFEITTTDGQNAEIGKTGEDGTVGEEGVKGSNGSGGSGGSGGGTGGTGGGSGGGSGGGTGGEDTSGIILPSFEVKKLDTTPNSLVASITFVDGGQLITPNKNITYTVTNMVTGKDEFNSKNVVGEGGWDTGKLTHDFTVDKLTPDTSYLLTVHAPIGDAGDYRQFVSRSFVTDSIGLSMVKDYATETAIHINLIKKAYSAATSGQMVLYNRASGTKIEAKPFTYSSDADTAIKKISFSNLDKNQEYMVKMEDVDANGIKYAAAAQSQLSVFTLKTSPIIGKPNVMVKNRTNSFEVVNQGITDSHKSITGMRYDVYTIGGSTPIAKFTSSSQNGIELLLDGDKLKYGTMYRLKAVGIAYDNEKTLEISSAFSDAFSMEKGSWPTMKIQLTSGNVAPGASNTSKYYDNFTGVLTVDFPENQLVADANNPIVLNIADTETGRVETLFTYKGEKLTNPTMTESLLTYYTDKNKLLGGHTYVLSLYGTMTLDGREENKNMLIGSVAVNTTKQNPLKTTLQGVTSPSSPFAATLKMEAVSPEDHQVVVPNSHESETIDKLTLKVYSGSYPTESALLGTRILENGTDGNFKDIIFGTTGYEINRDTFGLIGSTTAATYTITVSNALDYGGNKMKFTNPTDLAEITVGANEVPPAIPSKLESLDSFETSQIPNNMAVKYGGTVNEGLPSNTTIGLLARCYYQDQKKMARHYTYRVYDDDTNILLATIRNIPPAPSGAIYPQPVVPILFDKNAEDLRTSINTYLKETVGNTNPGVIVEFSNNATQLTRGRRYYFDYTAYLATTPDLPDTNYVYPDDGFPTGSEKYPLRSIRQDVPKVTPQFTVFPITSDQKTATLGYSAIDPDGTLVDPTDSQIHYPFIATGGTVEAGETVITVGTLISPTYDHVIIGGLNDNQNYTLQAALYAPYINHTIVDLKPKALNIIQQVFETPKTIINADNELMVTAASTPASNRFTIKVTSKNSGTAPVTRIAALEVKLHAKQDPDGAIGPFYLSNSSSNVAEYVGHLDYSTVQELSGQAVTITTRVLYDSGVSGVGADAINNSYKYSGYYAVQNLVKVDQIYSKLNTYIAPNNTFTGSTEGIHPDRSIFKVAAGVGPAVGKYYSAINNSYSMGGIGCNKFGFEIGGKSIAVKQLVSTKAFVTDDVNFGKVTPSYNLYYGAFDKVPDIVPTVSDVTFGFQLQSGEQIDMDNGKRTIDVKLVPVDIGNNDIPGGTSVTGSIELDSQKPNRVYHCTIGGLAPSTNYRIELRAKLESNSVALYDSRRGTSSFFNTFKTVSKVNITEPLMIYTPVSYLDKTYNLNFSLDQVVGYRIILNLYGVDSEGKQYNIPGLTYSDTGDGSVKAFGNMVECGLASTPGSLLSKMTIPVAAQPHPGVGLTYRLVFNGKTKYQVGIRAYTSTGSAPLSEEVFTPTFTPPSLLKPIVAAFYTPTSTVDGQGAVTSYGIDFNQMINDTQRSMVNDLYKVRIFEGNSGSTVDVTPDAYKWEDSGKTIEKVYTVAPTTQKFALTGLKAGSEYTIKVYSILDSNNDGAEKSISEEPIGGGNENYKIYEYTGRTINNDGFSLGTVTASQGNNTKKIRLVFQNAFGLEKIKSVSYTIQCFEQDLLVPGTTAFIPGAMTGGYNFFVLPPDVLTGNGSYVIAINFYTQENPTESDQPAETKTLNLSYFNAAGETKNASATPGLLERMAGWFTN